MCLGIPGEIVELGPADELAMVNVGGVRRQVNVGLLTGEDAVGVGDWVLIHVGFAMSKIDEAEAASTLEFLHSLGATFDEELAALIESQIE